MNAKLIREHMFLHVESPLSDLYQKLTDEEIIERWKDRI